MSWRFLQGQEAASWEGSSWAGAPSALSRLMPTAGTSCSPDSETGCSAGSRSGMTSAPSTVDRGADTSTSSAEASRVRTSAAAEPGAASPASGLDCGQKCSEWFAKYDRDSSSWRTRQSLLGGGWEEYSETWPRAGLMHAGLVFLRHTAERLKGGTGSGLLPTHVASDAKRAANGTSRNRRPSDGLTLTDWLRLNIGQDRLKPSFAEWMMLWPVGWTDLEPLEMGRYQQWQDSHGGR